MNERNEFASAMGMISIGIWSFMPLFTIFLKSIPVFQILSLSLCCGFFISAFWLTLKKRWHVVLQQSWQVWALGICGIFVNDACYIVAFKKAPAAHVEVINYLWPLIIVLLEAVILKKRLRNNHIAGFLLAFLSIVILLCFNNNKLTSFEGKFLPGYVFALMAALSWSLYVVLKKKFKKIPTEMVGMYCGMGALLAFLCHLRYETPVIPNGTEVATIVALGFTTSGIAYFCWDVGVRFGNLKFLSICSYFVPIFSLSILIIAKQTSMTTALPFSALLLLVSTYISSDMSRKFFKS